MVSEAIIYTGSVLGSLDDKGRLAIPVDYRGLVDRSSGGRYLCITRHAHWKCLIGFGRSRREDMLKELDRKQARAVEHGEDFNDASQGSKLFTLMKEVSFDASGRFVMPPLLRKLSGLENHVYFHGVGHFFCMWAPERLRAAGDDLAEELEICEFLLEEARLAA